MIRGFLGSKLTASEVCCNRLVSASKVLDTSTTAWFVDLRCCCMDADDSVGYAFSSNNWTMLGRSHILRVAGWATMLLLAHHMWASNEPPMVGVDKDKPCSQIGDTDYAFSSGLDGYKCSTIACRPKHTCYVQCFTTMGHDLRSSIALVSSHGIANKCPFSLNLLPHNFS
jgi:hypothetical protein